MNIGQNTEKSPGDLRRLSVSGTLVKNHQLTLMGKTRKPVNHHHNNKFLVTVNKKKITCSQEDFVVTVDHRVKIMDSER